MKRQWTKLGVLAMVIGPGCAAVGPDYQVPAIETPPAFAGEVAESQSSEQLGRWWEAFEDPQLSRLVEEVLLENLELHASVERVIAARELLGVARADRWPTLDGALGYARTRLQFFPQAGTFNQWSLGPDLAWEVDLFGRVRRSVEAAGAGLDAQVEDMRAVQVALVAETVATYLQVLSIEERLAIATSNVESQKQSQGLANDRFNSGMTGGLDPAQANVNLFSTRASLPGLRLAQRNAMHRLGVLLGKDPRAWMARGGALSPLPALPDSLMVGVPADLLRNRPDVRAAERRLAQQTASVGAAIARLYPSINLGGSWDWLAGTAGDLFDEGADESGSIGPVVSLPIFNAGRLRSQVGSQEAGMRRLELELRQRILVAQEEVENALIAVLLDREQVGLLQGATGAAERSVQLSRDLYTAGQSDFQNVLDAERTLFSLQDQVAAARLGVLLDVVALYRALGGGWATQEAGEDSARQSADLQAASG